MRQHENEEGGREGERNCEDELKQLEREIKYDQHTTENIQKIYKQKQCDNDIHTLVQLFPTLFVGETIKNEKRKIREWERIYPENEMRG